MSEVTNDSNDIKLDPWAASSLLQKAIRRGEVPLAQQAAKILYRFRGNGIFRRLANIAVEDVGIGDLALVCDVVQLSLDPAQRASLGSTEEVIHSLCDRLASAAKDRSVDYLYCSAMKLETALADREQLQHLSSADQVSLASDPAEPLVRRAVGALLAAATGDKRQQRRAVEELLGASPSSLPDTLTEMLMRLASLGRHPFPLMLLLIHSRLHADDLPERVAFDALPPVEFVGGIPLYTFDKHTSVGKRAIRRLATECTQVRQLLAENIPDDRWHDALFMAAFYADAVPVSKRRQWSAGEVLWRSGFEADMMSAGCAPDSAMLLLQCTQQHLGTLNELRRHALLGAAP